MPASDGYSKLAEECFRLAREAKDETDRLACLDLAQKWLEAASDQNEKAPRNPDEERSSLGAQKATKSRLQYSRWFGTHLGNKRTCCTASANVKR